MQCPKCKSTRVEESASIQTLVYYHRRSRIPNVKHVCDLNHHSTDYECVCGETFSRSGPVCPEKECLACQLEKKLPKDAAPVDSDSSDDDWTWPPPPRPPSYVIDIVQKTETHEQTRISHIPDAKVGRQLAKHLSKKLATRASFIKSNSSIEINGKFTPLQIHKLIGEVVVFNKRQDCEPVDTVDL